MGRKQIEQLVELESKEYAAFDVMEGIKTQAKRLRQSCTLTDLNGKPIAYILPGWKTGHRRIRIVGEALKGDCELTRTNISLVRDWLNEYFPKEADVADESV